MATSDALRRFHARRGKRLGGSDMAVVLGESRWKTRRQLWLEKTGQVPEQVAPDNDHQRRGKRQEAVMAALWKEQRGGKFIPTYSMTHPVHACLGGHPDRIWEEPETQARVLVEFKCPNVFYFKTLEQKAEAPLEWVIQARHYLLCNPLLAYAVLYIYSPEVDRGLAIRIDRDAAFEETLVREGLAFWQLVETMTPPEETEAEEEAAAEEASFVATEDAELEALAAQYAEAQALAADADAIKDAASEALNKALGKGTASPRLGKFAIGRVRLSVWQQADGVQLDAKKLAALMPLDRDAVTEYLLKYYTQQEVAGLLKQWTLDLTKCYSRKAGSFQKRVTLLGEG